MNTQQLTLPPFVKRSATSRAASLGMLPTAGTKEWLVLCYLSASGGCTDEEGQEGLRMSGNTYRPRRTKLTDKGLVVDSGTTRPTAAGRQAVVWRIKGGD